MHQEGGEGVARQPCTRFAHRVDERHHALYQRGTVVAIHKSHSNQNIFIPRSSTVSGTVIGESDMVVVTVSLSGPGISPPVIGAHPAAWNARWEAQLAREGIYVAVVDIDFLEDAIVQVQMEVTRPDGARHGFPWVFDIQAEAGDFHTASYGLGVL
jgi:hypothetical protein